MRAERLVIDTNVIVSGLITPGSTPAQVLDHALSLCVPVATRETLDELVETLLAPKFDAFLSRARRESTLDRLIPLIEIVETVQIVRACRDPKDNKFLEAAVNGQADVLITGDKDLLTLRPFPGIEILTPAEYLARVSARGE